MKNRLYLGAALILVLSVGIAFYYKKSYTTDLHPNVLLVSQQKNINGFELPRQLFEREYVIINFWATWCPPCIKETPSLINFVKAHPNFSLVAVSQDSSIQDIQKFSSLFPSMKDGSIEIVPDLSQEVARKFGVDKLPETFVYKKSNHKFFNVSGSADWEDPKLYQEILKQL